jgi:prepilin-type N-terminal cleavage/methylation domain-containing protein
MNAAHFNPVRSSGFSLLEVLCAILILGVALVGLTQGLATALSSTKESERQSTAALLAAGVIETVRAEGDLTDGDTDGEGPAGLELYRWKQTIQPTRIDGLHQVEVVVENARSGQAIYTLRTLLFETPYNPSTNVTNGRRDLDTERRRRRGSR